MSQIALIVRQTLPDALQQYQDFGPQTRSAARREKGAVTCISHRADTEDVSMTKDYRNELLCKSEDS